MGLGLSRSTLGDWIQKSAFALSPLVAQMKQRLLSGNLIQTDDTGVRVLTEIDGSKTGHLWVYGHPEGEVVFEFAMSRGRTGPRGFPFRLCWILAGRCLCRLQPHPFQRERARSRLLGACPAQDLRRERETDPVRCHTLLVLIRNLYEIEREAKRQQLPAVKQFQLRNEKANPLLSGIEAQSN